MKDIFKKLVFFSSLFFFYAHSVDVNKDIEFLSLSVGFQYEHKLLKSLRGKRLKFEGTYYRYAPVTFNKKENTLLFNPKRKGTGTLIIKNTRNKILHKINVDVKKVNLHKLAKEIGDLLITIDGIEIKILNNKVVIDGEVLLPKEMDRIDTIVNEYKKIYVTSLVTLSPKAQVQLARLIEKKIGYLTPPDEVRVTATHNRFVLEGEVGSQEQRARAELIANLYTQYDAEKTSIRRKQVSLVTNLIQLRPTKPPDKRKKIIQVVVHYVDLQKSYDKGFSFQWTPQITDNTGVTARIGGNGGLGLTSAITATISNFFPKLNWAKSFNFARVLHSSNLTLEEGVGGTISTTEQVPYTVRKGDGELSVATAQATISTEIKPTIIGLRKDTVHMEVNVTIGSFAGSVANGNPITNTRKIKTSLHVRGGLSAVLGGLIRSSLSQDYNRLPSGSVAQTPIINLVSSKKYDTSKSQFVVFITPFIKGTASAGVESIKRKFKVDGN